MKLVGTITVRNTLGESVLWDVDTQSLWWTDIQERLLYRFDWNNQTLKRVPVPERLCSFGFVRRSNKLIAAFESGFAFFNPEDGTTVWLGRPELNHPGMRMNDGRVDCQGRFWAGSMAETAAGAGKANLYCIDGSGVIHRRETDITISNSICWSPDAGRFYFADSPRRMIWRYMFDPASGAISDRRFFAMALDGAQPDGASVDAEGFLWSAQWGAGRVVRYAPDGRIDSFLEVPTNQPTCVTFGGPQLDLLFVTTARQGMTGKAAKHDVSAGDVFVYNVGVAGSPEGRFLPDVKSGSM
ncbi:MAG: SMP-30/gluconolactonase/LRE family protein [Alphaproteobacteria bacterium]|nr:SMP-30/gluconolactonase/LRE family protein [Alphaproteobacteria bacterium]MDE2492488.1 SMP-30/gluconolactonase/LRE family protein [Alphaproteobacteria bacterium]